MSRILAQTQRELDEINHLVSKKFPIYRQAYSDRTAFIMACLSELAYIKFNKAFFTKDDDEVMNKLSNLINEDKLPSFQKFYKSFGYDYKLELENLKDELSFLNIKLLKTFDENGTQAMIVSTDMFYVLAFRGTEASSIQDIKADIKAQVSENENGVRVHKGFKDAFSEVHIEIQKYLDTELEDKKPFFITGHSLGGALATVATKELSNISISACYTFGSPRVGNEKWIDGIKTPIYRLVNSADPVTMLPPGDEVISAISTVLYFCRLKQTSKILIAKFGGYCHIGYMRFLADVENSNYKNAKILYSANIFRRLKAYFKNFRSLKKLPLDHSITVYRKKLKFIALDRNKDK